MTSYLPTQSLQHDMIFRIAYEIDKSKLPSMADSIIDTWIVLNRGASEKDLILTRLFRFSSSQFLFAPSDFHF